MAKEIWSFENMLKVHEMVKLSADPDDVWRTVSDFGALAEWHPAAVTSLAENRGGDIVRVINIPGGGVLTEKLISQDDEGMHQKYAILDGPLPVNNYESTISVQPSEGGCEVHWEGRFQASGADDEAAKKVVRSIYTSGLSALEKRFS